MKKMQWISVSVIAFCLTAMSVSADVKLPAVFGDGMVLQQRSSVPVWGWADPGEKVTVKGSWQWFGASATADQNGAWRVRINTPRAGGPQTLKIQGNNEIILKDILFGEVWVCSGQSNMEYTLEMLNTDEHRKAAAEADYPQIRLFNVTRVFNAKPQTDCQGQWQVCTPETAKRFSAVGYYFGRELHQKLKVPIGLINASWGGTPAEAWTSAEALRAHGDFDLMLDRLANPEQSDEQANEQYQQDLARWEQKVAEVDAGTKENWQEAGLDDADWKTMEQPMLWSQTELAKIDGVVWFRRVTNLPPSWARSDLELHLGPIDDIDTVWVNGVKIGSTFGWMKPRTYQIPKSVLRVGPNVIAVRIIDTGIEGGFNGTEDDMRIGPPGADAKSSATVARTWKYKVGYSGYLPAVPLTAAEQRLNQNSPSALYNAMIQPLIPFRIAGAIWYQGESNRDRWLQYRTLFPAMITDWRTRWGQGNFPFYYVQIAPYNYGNVDDPLSGYLYEAQMMTLKAVPNVGMAVTMDIGDKDDIHPKNKVDVGKRLSLWALAKTYNQRNIVYSGPIYKSMKVERDTIRLSFDYIGGGLVSRGGPLVGFEIAGSDRAFVPAKAEIDGNSVVVSSSQVPNPVAVRYAFKNWISPNLFNAEGLPASSFRTDDWPMQ
jgi:sialate O-acetylesterase